MTDALDRCLRELRFDEAVYAVDWSPDGTQLAIGDGSSAVEILTGEGRRLWRRVEHQGSVRDVRWSPDGRRLASAAEDQTMRIWDAREGRAWVVGRTTETRVALGWSPGGRRLACGSGEMILLDTETGEGLDGWSVAGESAWGVSWSPDGTRLAAGFESGQIRLREDRSHIEVAFPDGHTKQVVRLDWARDGRRLASASLDDTIRVWDVRERRCVLVLEGHGGDVLSVSWSPDGALLASGSIDRAVRIWSSETGEEVARLDGHSDIVRAVAFSPDGTRVASTSNDSTVRIWDVSDLISRRENPVRSTLDAYVARQAATVGRNPRRTPLALWVPRLKNAGGRILGKFKGTGSEAGGVAILPDNRRLAIGQDDGILRLVDLGTGVDLWIGKERHTSTIDAVACSRQGTLIASASFDRHVRIWNTANGDVVAVCKHDGSLRGVCFSPDGNRLATACHDSTVRVWNVERGEEVLRCDGQLGLVNSVDWSPDARLLASASGDKTLRIWDAADGTELHRFDHSTGLSGVAWSPCGERLATTASGGEVAIRNRTSWNEVARCEGHKGSANCVAWSPDRRLVASGGGGDDRTVRIWDAATGREVHCFDFDEDYAWHLSWSPNGAFLAASLGDDVYRLWDVRDFLHPEMHVPRPPRKAPPPPVDLKPLPAALARLARLGIGAPCSHIRDLLCLTAGTPQDAGASQDAEPLASHAGVRRIVEMRWPAAARVGLVALLLPPLPQEDEWRLPAGLSPAELRDALADGLLGDAVTPDAPPVPVAALCKNADVLDERLLTLLEVVGPDAVAADPGLPLRLLPQVPKLPAMTAPKRRLLGLRLRLDDGGPAHGHGAGIERTGIDVRGDWRSMLPWQLALPEAVLRGRFVRREILYRARSGEEPPRLRPTVLVLDVSPPVFGPIERTTRLAAHVVASSLLEAGLPVVLVTAGGRGSVRTLERPADLVEIWTERSLEGADEPGVLRIGRAMRETLAGDALSPVVVLLSHVFFGADEEPPEVPGLRGFFVQYPGRTVRPTLAAACERWESVRSGEVEGLGDRLGRLVG